MSDGIGESAATQSTDILRVPHDKRLIIAATLTAGLTYALVVLGSTVRVTDSGMGCPSWPLCYNQLGPIFHLHPILEESHRYLASIVTISALVTLYLSYKTKTAQATRRFAQFAFGLVIFQVLLGGLTVLTKNAPWTVTVHLITGLVFLASTTATAVVAIRSGSSFKLSNLAKSWGGVTFGATLVLLVSGSLVVASGAGSACPTWPVCFATGQTRLVDVALVHRSMAFLAGAAIIRLVALGWKGATSTWHWAAASLMTVLGLVAMLGAFSAISKSNPTWADLHLAMAALLWVLLTILIVDSKESSDRSPDPQLNDDSLTELGR